MSSTGNEGLDLRYIHSESKNCATIHLFITFANVGRFLANVNSALRSLYVVARPSVCLSVVCNVRAPYSAG